ncbi:hypothetical protein [Methylobacter sp.]|uniref:hypothetical protein n=1 Tax=Methylobacter sp. TaxID=2051955 RepID=UPI002FDEBFAD
MIDNGYMKRDLTKESQLIGSFEKNDKLRKSEKNYEYQEIKKENFPESNELRFYNINESDIYINEENIKIIKSRVTKASPFDETIYLSISEWKTENFKEDNSLFKLLIPIIPNTKNIMFHNYFSNLVGMNDNKKTYFMNGISFGFKKKNFQLYQLNDFFILEILNSIGYEEFNQLSRVILAAFGFITGYVPLDYGYFFSYENESDAFTGIRFNSSFLGTYKTNYALFSLNAYEYFTGEPFTFEDGEFKKNDEIREIESKLKAITKKMFSDFCYMMNDDRNFANVIFSILEVNNTKNSLSLLSTGALYSVALERITNIISQDNEDNIAPIKDKGNAKELVKALVDLAKDFFKSKKLGIIPHAIEARLKNINSLTNQDKLYKPYEILNIPLSPEDKKIIKYRNDFLHGNNMEELEFDELFRINLELNFLVNTLVFKKIGWTGIVKNLSKTYLEHKELEILKDAKSYKELGTINKTIGPYDVLKHESCKADSRQQSAVIGMILSDPDH